MLGPAEAILRSVELPLLPVEDLRMMLKLNSKMYLQQELNDYVFDCHLFAMSGASPEASGKPEASKSPTKCRALVGGIKRPLLEQVVAGIKLAGLVPDQVVPMLVTPANAFERAEPDIYSKETSALVDLGFKQSTITVIHHGELHLSRCG